MEYAESQGRGAADDLDVVPNARCDVDHDRLNEITGAIVNSALLLHRDLGPGLLESVYESVLARMLQQRGFRVRCQSKVQFSYMGIQFDDGFRVDMLVEDCIVVELKSVANMDRVFARQLLTYLRLLNMPVGLVINFGSMLLKNGLQRVVNQRPRSRLVTASMTTRGDDSTAYSPRLRGSA